MDVTQINANLLVALDALLLERSVTGAGRRVGVTQPTMSYALSRLRDIFGDPLLVRSGSRLVPTPLAERLAGQLRTAVDGLGQVLAVCERFDPTTSERTFRVAASDGLQMVALGPLMRRVEHMAPRVNLVMQPESRTCFDALERGELDLLVSADREVDARARSAVLLHQRYVCVARRDHPKIRCRLGLRTFCELPHVLMAHDEEPGLVDRLLDRHGRARRVAVRVPDYAGLGHLVAETDLVATVPEAVARRFAESLPVTLHRPPLSVPSFDVCLAWHPRHDQEPGSRWLRDLFLEVAQALRQPADGPFRDHQQVARQRARSSRQPPTRRHRQ